MMENAAFSTTNEEAAAPTLLGVNSKNAAATTHDRAAAAVRDDARTGRRAVVAEVDVSMMF
jgi:hypothetical protein